MQRFIEKISEDLLDETQLIKIHISSILMKIMSKWFFFKFYRMDILNKDKAVPLQAWSGPEGSRKLKFPDFMTTAQDGGKVVSLTHLPPLPSVNTPGTHFC